MRRLLIGTIATLAPLLGVGAIAAPSAQVTVFAAASLKNSLDTVDALYQQKTGIKVTAVYAASSTLARQIEQGAPAEIFISADPDWMDDAAAHGLIQAGSRRDLLGNRLALIAPKDSRIVLHIGRGFPLLQALGSGRLAMAGPDVPAGRYGRQALTALGVWTALEPHVVYGDSVRAALAFVSRGEAPLGIVYDTDAGVDPGVRVVDMFPASTHPPIVYPAALTRTATGPQAGAYLAFLESPEAAVVFRRYGFRTFGG